MDEKPEIVRIKLEDAQRRTPLSTAAKAFQVKIDTSKTVESITISKVISWMR